MTANKDVKTPLLSCLKELHLPTFRSAFESVGQTAQQEALSYESYLLELAMRECQERRHNRIERLLHESRLPLEKNLQTFDLKRLPAKIVQQTRALLRCPQWAARSPGSRQTEAGVESRTRSHDGVNA